MQAYKTGPAYNFELSSEDVKCAIARWIELQHSNLNIGAHHVVLLPEDKIGHAMVIVPELD